MEIIQIIFITFALFAYLITILRFKDKKINSQEFGFWSIIWLGIIITAFIPSQLTYFAQTLGIHSGVSLLSYTAIILAFYLIFRLYVKLEHQREEITKLTRIIAIKNGKTPKNNR